MSVARLIGIAVAGLALLGLSFASSGRLSVTESDDAIVRLSIAARPERLESCRTVSDEELANLAPQMRQRVICEGTTARYQLELWHNGRLVGSQLLRGGGLRHDRRIYVLRDTKVAPGSSRVRVSIVRLDTVAATADSLVVGDDAERARRQRGREAAIPAELHIDVAHDLAAREVLLVMYEPEQRRLVAKTPATAGESP